MVTPSIIPFNHKKFDTLQPAVLVNFTDNGQYLYFENEPVDINGNVLNVIDEWLDLYDITQTSLKVKLNSDVDTLTAGSHSKTIFLKIKNETTQQISIVGSFTVNLELQETIVLSVSPITANFTYEIGGTAPTNKTISVTSENAWTVTKNAAWLNLPTTSGTGTGTFTIGVTSTGLAAGTYYDTLTVNDGVTTKTIAVSLAVSDANTGTDYLYIYPNLINFGYSIGGSIPPLKNIEINASASWTATADQSWVNLTVASGTAGANIIPVVLQNLTGLDAGDHFSTITFTVGTIVKTVTIQLTIYSFVTNLLTDGDLYFTDDKNNVNIASGRSDTFVKLDFTTLYKSKSYFLNAEIPIFQGLASKRIGERPKVIIGQQEFLNYAETSLIEPYKPVSLNVAVTEQELITKTTVQTVTMSNLNFIKGTTPLNNWISTMAKKVYLTKNGILYFSVLTNGTAASTIAVTGAVTKTFYFTSINAEFLTAVIHINEIGVLTEGDALTISLLGNTIEVNIIAETTEQSIVFFENEWGVWDAIEFTGDVAINDNFSRETAVFRKNELYTETKIIDVTKPITISLNTGEVHTDNNVATISAMLASKNIYLKTNGFVVKVNPTTTKLPTYQTDRELRSFDLTFKNVIE